MKARHSLQVEGFFDPHTWTISYLVLDTETKRCALVDSVLAGGPQAQAIAKDLIRSLVHRPIDDVVIEETAQCIAGLRATPEAKEGVGAFLDKREPPWRGG